MPPLPIDKMLRLLRHRDLIVRHGPGKGIHFNPANGISYLHLLQGKYELGVQKALRNLARPGGIAYDIGANVGFFSLLLAKFLGPTGRVYSFEPAAANRRALRHNIRLNGFTQIVLRREAIGKQDGRRPFVLSQTHEWCHFKHLPDETPPPGNTEIEVPTRSLDSLYEQDTIPPPQLIKIDVEGFEVEVLRGGRSLLQRKPPYLIIEVHYTNPALRDFLRDCGYRVETITLSSRGNLHLLPGLAPSPSLCWALASPAKPRPRSR